MKIQYTTISVRDLVAGYEDKGDDGVFGYSGQLDIRPPYQREFVYKDKQREAVIDTVTKGFPLNVMYWAVRENGTFEVIDGQQRTISIAQYVDGDFSFKDKFFHNLTQDKKDEILNYELTVYQCTGTDSEKLDWFETINIAGEELTDQELRNAVYSGSWVSAAKRIFSKTNGAAYGLGSAYLKGDLKRQDYLETAIKWINGGKVEAYMAKHQHDQTADELWTYFRNVIKWTKDTFTKYRSEMKGLPWGEYYNEFSAQTWDSNILEARIAILMQDDEIKKKSGIYHYVLDGDERHLNLRTFDNAMRRTTYERQRGICPMCDEHFEMIDMHADHKKPWSKGGKTTLDNCQMLCRDDNLVKSAK